MRRSAGRGGPALETRRIPLTKIILTAAVAGSISMLSLIATAGAEPSEGKSYGQCPAGSQWSQTLKKCVQ